MYDVSGDPTVIVMLAVVWRKFSMYMSSTKVKQTEKIFDK
jgi:hypothetical protein